MGKKKDNLSKSYIKNPHDSYFMDAFSNKKSIVTFLNTVLPAELLQSIDLSNIEFDLKSYLNEKLSKRISDLAVKTSIKSKSDKKI